MLYWFMTLTLAIPCGICTCSCCDICEYPVLIRKESTIVTAVLSIHTKRLQFFLSLMVRLSKFGLTLDKVVPKSTGRSKPPPSLQRREMPGDDGDQLLRAESHSLS